MALVILYFMVAAAFMALAIGAVVALTLVLGALALLIPGIVVGLYTSIRQQ